MSNKTYTVALTDSEWALIASTLAAGALYIGENMPVEDGDLLTKMETMDNIAEVAAKMIDQLKKGME